MEKLSRPDVADVVLLQEDSLGVGWDVARNGGQSPVSVVHRVLGVVLAVYGCYHAQCNQDGYNGVFPYSVVG